MKAQFLKLAGVKTEKEFYSRFPDEKSFMAKYGKQIKKAYPGTSMPEDPPYGFNSNYQDPGSLPPRDYTPIKPMQGRGFQPIEVSALKNAKLAPLSQDKNPDFMSKLSSMIDVPGKIIGGVQKLKAEIEARKSAQQWNQVSDLQLQASATKDIDANRQQMDNMTKKREMMMPVNTGEEFFPIYGVGTEPLAKNGKKMKGKKAMSGAVASMIGSGMDKVTPAIYGDNAGVDLGGTAGEAIGNIWGPVGGLIGKQVGQLAGFALDRNPAQMKKANESTARNANMMAFNNMNQNNAYMRAGGHLQEYTPPSERALQTFDMGGDLQTHWGGYTEPISQNPYLPDGGETVMFRGQSHDESDGKGNSGIGITFGNNPVEVERGEPAVKLPDGGQDNSLVVFGNLPINKTHANMLGDPKAAGKKYKSYVADLSRKEALQNETINKSTSAIDELNPITPFDKLTFASHTANLRGADMNLKQLAQKKETAGALQEAINKTAEEHGLVAEDLARGNIKKAKTGIKVNTDINKYSGIPQGLTYQHGTNNSTMYDLQGNPINTPIDNTYSLKGYTDTPSVTQSSSYTDENPQVKKPTWMDAVNSMMPYLRPTNAEQLDPRQMSGEMFALSQNQQEPVPLQTYKPDLSVPYDVSHQDTLNENQAIFRGVQRMIGNNPAAQANIAAQQYQANEKVLGEQFRENQAMKNQTYAQNRQTLNQAQERNLQAYDQQSTRQSQAKSNTKEVAQTALNSINDKFLKNKLSNRTLQTYENMYNYRFSPDNMRAENWNGLAQFDTSSAISRSQNVGLQGTPAGMLPTYESDASGNPVRSGYKKIKVKETSRNGSIVSSFKNF